MLRFANWGGAGDDSAVSKAYREVFEEFERRHPGVEVQVEGTPGSQEYVNKMLLSFVAKSAPDVMTLDAASCGVFIDNGLMRDLSPTIEADKTFSISNYFPNVVGINQRGEKLYAVPLDFTPMVVFINKKLFKQAGVAIPSPDWSIEEFRETAKALTKNGKYGFKFITWMPGWVMWIWNNGGDVLSPDGKRATGFFDSDATVRVLQTLADMVLVDHSAPALSQAAAAGVDPFANGECAMEVSGHWAMTTYAESKNLDFNEIAVLPMPHRPGTKSQTVMYEAGVGITRDAKEPELAWELIKWMTSAEAQRKIQASHIAICARKDVATELAIDEREKAFLKIVDTARAPWGATVRGYDFLETEGVKMMDGVLKNGLSLPEAAREAAPAIDNHFSRL